MVSEIMWEFPSSGAFFSSNGFLIFWTAGISCVSAVAWFFFARSIVKNTKESGGDFLKNLAGAAVTFLLAFFSWYGLISNYRQVSQCRNLDLNSVKSVRVTKMPNENSFGSAAIRLNNAAKIQEGLRTLKSAYSYDRRKKLFVYGYRIELIVEQNPVGPIALYYFAETADSQKADVVILSCGENSDGIATSDNTYTSSSFGNWLRENIEPEFKKNQ
jgi:hypothetical protein